MKYFRLGKHKLSTLCLGTWSLGGENKNNISYGNMNIKKCNQILSHAYKCGINFFDTANVYGEAEKRLGNFFYKKRSKVFIATKVGCISYDKKLNFSARIVRKQIEKSLENLKTNYLDIVQLYNPSPSDKNIKEALDLLKKMKNKKIINHISISLKNPRDYIFFRKLFKFDTVQCNFNLLDQRLHDDNIFSLLKKDKSKLLARTILNFGIFTEKFIKQKNLEISKKDHKHLWDFEQINRWKNYAKTIRKKINLPIENISYQFINNFTPIKIIGAVEKKHIDIALKNNEQKLAKRKIDVINEIYLAFSTHEVKKRYIKMKT